MASSPDHTSQFPMPAAAEDPKYKPFFDGLRESKLRTRRCKNCQEWQWPPQPYCFSCQHTDFDWHDLPTEGEVYSYTVMYRAFDPYHQDKLPYGVVIVTLGPVHVTGRYLGDPEEIECGMRVEAVWDDRATAASSPAFAVVK